MLPWAELGWQTDHELITHERPGLVSKVKSMTLMKHEVIGK